MNRILVFGISGATWEMIDPLLAHGRLPTMQRLISAGCRATLASVRAPGDKHFRPQIAWSTLATGIEPEQHGVTRFFHTADDMTAPALWQKFQEQGLRVGVFGWPITWPVRKVNGFLIPGYDGRDPATWPAELSFLRSLDRRQEASAQAGKRGSRRMTESIRMLRTFARGGVSAATFLRVAGAAVDSNLLAPAELRPLVQRRARLRVNTDIFLRLCRQHQPQFAAFVTFLADFASHRFWMFQEPHRFPDAPRDVPPRLRSAVADSYEAVDRALGSILQEFGSETIVAVVSEHGMEAEIESTEIGPRHYVLCPDRLKEFAGIEPSVPAVPIARWIAFRPPANQIGDVAARLGRITVEGTAIPLFQIDVHRDEVIAKLALWRRSLPGREELESLRVQCGDRSEAFTFLARPFGRRRSAMHAENGILILSGPGIRHGTIERAQLIDVAPTLLRAAGIDASHGMHGRVLEVF